MNIHITNTINIQYYANKRDGKKNSISFIRSFIQTISMVSPRFERIHVLEQSNEKPSVAFIYLHGSSGSGEDSKSELAKYLAPDGRHPFIKFYFPSATERYLPIQDKVTRYWFRVVRTGPENGDVEGNTDDADAVSQMIEHKIQEIEKEDGLPRERIVVGGNSQGGMVSYYAAYARGVKCGGIVGIASSFPFNVKMISESPTPMLSIYGQKDAFIHSEVISKMWADFRANKINFNIKSLLRGGHNMDAQYAKHMFEWLEKKFSPL